MKEERINPNFNINAKYESMLENAKSIVEHYKKENSNSDCSNKVALAFDVVNYLPVLQSQLKAKEEVIKEAREYVNHSKKNIDESGMYVETYTKWKLVPDVLDDLLKILSKGENK